MNDESLRDLLRQADQAIARPPLAADLQARITGRLIRRRALRRGMALTLLAIGLLPLLYLRHPAPSQQVGPPVVAMMTTREASAWDAVVEQRTADAIVTLHRREALWPPTPIDALQKLQIENEMTAATLLAAGDYFAHKPAFADQGIDNYKRVRDFFPHTPSALVADRRLSHDRNQPENQ